MSNVNGVKQTRKEKAATTRRRIIAAAAEEFVHSGYHGTAMTAIATRAGYAVQTVYFVFHTKAELFAAALDNAVLGPEGKPPLDQDWARDAVGDVTDPRATIRAFIQGGAQIYERAAALSEVARAAAPTDPDAHARQRSGQRPARRGVRGRGGRCGARRDRHGNPDRWLVSDAPAHRVAYLNEWDRRPRVCGCAG